MQGPYATKNPEIAQQFKKDFYINDRWILEDPNQWIFREITEHLMILIPVSYLHQLPISLEQVGLQMNGTTPLTVDAIINRYTTLVSDDVLWETVQKNTGISFIEMLTNNHIFDRNNKHIEWVIHLSGHGGYQKDIATIPLSKFSLLLDFFNTEITVALFTYTSCYAAGYNTAQVYGELTEKASAKEYSFPIVTQATADLITRGKPIVYQEGKLLFPYDFKQFIHTFAANRWPTDTWYSDQWLYEQVHRFPYATSLKYIMPPTAYIDVKSLPLIRFPHSPAWFPLTEDPKSVINITRIMALTRQKPLIIQHNKEQPAQIILFNTNYIPFKIIVEENSHPYFIITKPGDVKIYLHTLTLPSFAHLKQLKEPLKGPFYKGHKLLYIENVIIQENTMHMNNVIIDYAYNCMYYTDSATNKKFSMKNSDLLPYDGDYESKFPKQQFINQKIKEDEQIIKKMQKIIEKRNKSIQETHSLEQQMASIGIEKKSSLKSYKKLKILI